MLKVAVPQLAPCWLNRNLGIRRVIETIEEAGQEGARLIVFSEGYLPGYPFWLSAMDGARFDCPRQKEWYAFYSDQAVRLDRGHLDPVCEALKRWEMAAYIGIIERAGDRSGHSLYCSYVYVSPTGTIESVQRKLQPTYEERLVWAQGDGAGLVTHRLGDFTLGGLNCWENWMPLTRAALYAQGEDLHVAAWPGSLRNTAALTPVIAQEGRSYCVSVSAIMNAQHVDDHVPYAEDIRRALGDRYADGGSCVAAPDGQWILEPLVDETGIRYCQLDPAWVRRERQNFDPAGHYSRPDVTRLVVDRRRQSLCEFRSL